MNTVTLKTSEIAELELEAQEHGTVALAKMIGISKTQLYRILRGHNSVKTETAEKIDAWMNADAPQPGQPEEPTKKRRTRPTKSELITTLRNPVFLEIAVIELCKAIREGRLRNVTIILGGYCTCGD